MSEITSPELSIAHQELSFTYKNWRGEIPTRRAMPQSIWFGATEWHPEPQWLMRAMDLDNAKSRDFAMKDMREVSFV